ncbi:hypothetical protein BH11PAT1_BH11PAT1_7520 [soil metagenome]
MMRDHLPNQLLVISSYPPKGNTHHSSIVGVASYTKNTVVALQKYATNPIEITVLAEKLVGTDTKDTDEGILVKRLWQRNSFATFWVLFKEIAKNYKATTHILIEFEVAMFGGMSSLLPFPLFLLALKLMNKQTTIVFHQVINDLDDLHGHINLPEHSYQAKILTPSIHLFYRLILLLASQAIVFDDALRTSLSRFSNKKISVIPHGVETFSDLPTQEAAKKSLLIDNDACVLLYFGFIAWYKGTDLLVEAFQKIPESIRKEKKLQLIIAGGPNPNHVGKAYYDEYLRKISAACDTAAITVTGFVPEEHIARYYQTADLVLFPYRTYMSASGPLSLCFSFHKPFLLSQTLKPTLRNADIRSVLQEVGRNEEGLVFSMKDDDFLSKITDPKRIQRLQKVSEKVADLRSWKAIGKQYYERLFI